MVFSVDIARRAGPGFALALALCACDGIRPNRVAEPVLFGDTCRAVPLSRAHRFALERCGEVGRITVTQPWRGARDVSRYLLVPRGRADLLERARTLARIPDVTVVSVPVERIACLSTTYAGALDLLGRIGQVVGVGSSASTWTPSLRARIDSGKVADLGKRGMQVSQRMESLLLLRPDIVFSSGSGIPAYDKNDQLREFGLPVVVASEWMEDTPLGRAEWIRFVAAFTGDDSLARSLYAGIERRYDSVRRLVARAPGRPTVFSGSPWSGAWYMPGGRSYVAAVLADAGGHYLWTDIPGAGSVPVGVESVLLRAHDADVWIHPTRAKSLVDLAGSDPRNRFFRALGTGRVYGNDKRTNKAGGNDYWESGVYRPDRVLSDVAAFLHPSPGDTEMVYYRHLGDRP